MNKDPERQPLTPAYNNMDVNYSKTNNTEELDKQLGERRKKYMKWGLIGIAILVGLILVIVLPITLTKKKPEPTNPPTQGPTEAPTPAPTVEPIIPDKTNPYVVDETLIERSSGRLYGTLQVPFDKQQLLEKQRPILREDPVENNFTIDWYNKIPRGKNNAFKYVLSFRFDMLDTSTVCFTLTESGKERYSIPDTLVNRGLSDPTMKLDMVGFNFNANPFGFTFKDVGDQSNVYVDAMDQTLVFMDKYIQMDMVLPSHRLYGFGERVHEFGLGQGSWTMWASGQDSPYDDGNGRKGLYGVHPFILVQSGKKKDDFFGIFFRNSNAQSPIVRLRDDGSAILSYITTGGQIEAYFFLHGSAQQVIKNYHNLIGRPQLPPFWSLGWQQASWKYQTLDDVKDVLKNYNDANMPLETIYFDIPYMDNYADFSVNSTAFPDVPAFVESIHQNNQKLVVIVDAAISADDTENKYYKKGNEDQIFIQSSTQSSDKYGKNLVSSVWPKKAVFVDWLHNKAQEFWNQGLGDLYKLAPFDGLWLDMSEPTTFANGEIPHDQQTPSARRLLAENGDVTVNGWYMSYSNGTATSVNDTYHLPFIVIGSDENPANWDNMTISLNATHPGYYNELEYNLHSLYGHMMAKSTQKYYMDSKIDVRPFILTRSTFASGGKFTSHWLGDNWRDWKYLRYSIAGIMNMNMFGIPHVGADVCGFFGEKKDDEMCLRWIQLSTFYPLARAHQNLTWKGNDSERSEPYLLGDPYKDMARTALYDRYTYSRFLYTCLFKVHNGGGSCIDPTFFLYPTDEELYNDYESTFMVGGSVLVAPVLTNMTDLNGTYDVYFPKGKWVNLANLGEVIDTTTAGAKKQVTAGAKVNSYLKAGSVIPIQDNSDFSAKTTADLLKKPIALVANRDQNKQAKGSLFLDTGLTMTELDNKEYEMYTITMQANSIHLDLNDGMKGNQNHTLQKIVITDASDLKDISFACVLGLKYKGENMTWNFNDTLKTLELTPSKETKFSEILHIYYGTSKDLNLCEASTFAYRVKDNQVVDFNTTKPVTFTLEHSTKLLPDIQATVQWHDQGIINIQWSWGPTVPEGKRTPVGVPSFLVDTTPKLTTTYTLLQYVSITNDPFTISVKSRNAQEQDPFFKISALLYDEYLNVIRTTLKTLKDEQFTGIFGLGERASKDFFYQDGVYTLWTKDQASPIEDGKAPTKGLYGVHPFYMFRHNTTSWAGVYTNMAQAQDWWIKNNDAAGRIDLTTISTGGITDLYVFIDQPKPETIIERYYSLVGKPVLIPQWALGWHQCKWGYQKTDDMRASVQGYNDNGIPLEAQWTDIDYMDAYKDFTVDPTNFKDLKDFVDELHKSNKKFVPIVDAGVAYRPNQNYSSYDSGIADDVFLKINGQPFVGKVWPNEAVFPDFTNDKTQAWWSKQLDSMYDKFAFDGLWLDMNEVSNFCNGACFSSQDSDKPISANLLYIPGAGSVDEKTLSMDVKDSKGQYQLDMHSVWGSQETYATHQWFQSKNQRTFIIERSSFAGMGKYGSRWLGDNHASEEYMGLSVSGTMLMNMFGIPLVGSDICGFMGDTNPELCARWHVLGSFYPFSRNHNDEYRYVPQTPWSFTQNYEDGKTYKDIMVQAIKNKYALVRYYYTSLFMMSLEGQKPFFKPLFFTFPEDSNAYANITYNIMLGDSLKLSINSDTLGQNTTYYYFPAGTWCSVFNPNEKCFVSSGQSFELESKAYSTHAHLRSGTLIPMQSVTDERTTYDLQQKPVDFHVLGEVTSTITGNWRSSGIYINDDGVTTNQTGTFNQYSIAVEGRYNRADEFIVVKIFHVTKPTTLFPKEDTECYGINQNDFLNKIYLYNADTFKKSDDYTAKGVLQGQTTEQGDDIGTAKYDGDTRRIVFTPTNPICLSKYPYIVLQPKR